MTVRDAHCSGYHSASLPQWAALDALVDQRADVAAFTERRNRSRHPGWKSWSPTLHGHDNAAECTITWRDSRYELMASGAEQVGSVVFYRGNGKPRPGVWATWALLADAHGFEYLRIVAHMPSSVQAGRKWSGKAKRVAAWASAARGLRRLRRRLRRQYRPDEDTTSGDMNLNMLQRVWRRVVTAALGTRRMRLLPPPTGTHGRRAIDAHLSTMRGPVEVLPAVKGFDHRPILATLHRTKAHQLPRATDPRLQEIP